MAPFDPASMALLSGLFKKNKQKIIAEFNSYEGKMIHQLSIKLTVNYERIENPPESYRISNRI